MKKQMQWKLALCALLTAGVSHAALAAAPTPDAEDTLSVQNMLTGATTAVRNAAGNGAGVKIGIIDTGVAQPWLGFGPDTVNPNSSYCFIDGCARKLSVTDDNGHGTFVSSEIAANLPQYGMSGVAPLSTIYSMKVLDAQGSGFSDDVASGITMAADRNARVMNLSLAANGTAAQQKAFYESLAASVNYAVATKGSIIVFAGGNAGAAFAGGLSINGFTDDAIRHMIFMGSTNGDKNISTFSNTAGTGSFVSTTGQTTSIKSMWMMADGEDIWGASTYHDDTVGYGYITQMSGTSMAAPQATGAAALLLSRWPYLLKNGTVPAILEASAQDLGSAGVDSTYGSGFLRVDLAMQAIGPLEVPVKGKMVPLSGGQIVAGGAIGAASGIAGALRNAVGFDSFGRDFAVNAAAAVTTRGQRASISPATVKASGMTAAATRSFTDAGNGRTFAFSGSAQGTAVTPEDSGAGDWSFAMTTDNSYIGAGHGSAAPLLLNEARWGRDSAFSGTDAGAGGTLLALVPDATFSFIGRDFGPSRISAGFSRSADDVFSGQAGNVSANGAFIGYTYKATRSVKVSATASFLGEQHQLLGTQSSGPLSLGDAARSESFGLGTNIDLGGGYSLGLDAAYGVTTPGAAQNSLIGNLSQLQSMSASLALAKSGVAADDDALGIQVAKPMRVFAGAADVTTPVGADANGNPILQTSRVSLAPQGSETDVNFTYARPFGKDVSGSLSLSGRNDADNVPGARDVAGMVRLKMKLN